jgi:large subunit ribosomal protein L7/L12
MADTKKQSTTQLMEAIKNMTVLELYELVKALEETFEVSAAMPAATVATTTAPSGGETSAPAEAKTEVTVVLNAIGDPKDRIQVIKVVRTIIDLGLQEAKTLVDSLPATIKENISSEEAESIKKKLEEAGGGVIIK